MIDSRGIEIKPILSIDREIWRGAEAVLYRGTFLGVDVVIKIRTPKEYMPQDLDKLFRYRRTVTEAKALLKALSMGIPTPYPLYVDPDNGILILSYVEGDILRDVVDKLCDEELCKIMKTLGIYTAKLHEAGIVHGDLTTGNVVVHNSEIYIIDFGLSEFTKILDEHAIDVHILFRSIESTHLDREKIMKKCFIDGYRSMRRNEVVEYVLNIVNRIRLSGRYVKERRATVWEL